MQFDIEDYDGAAFKGAKMALYLGDRMAVLLRDKKEGLVYPDHWDLPGGGREGAETPFECAQRECSEELGLWVPQTALLWGRSFEEGRLTKWFFVAQMPQEEMSNVVFGDEGQRWEMMDEQTFVTHPKGIPAFQHRVSLWIDLRQSII